MISVRHRFFLLFGPVNDSSASQTAELAKGFAQRLVNVFGGPSNAQAAEHVAVTRLSFVLRDASRTDQEALKLADAVGVMKASENVWQVVAGQRAQAIAAALNLNLDAPSRGPDQVARELRVISGERLRLTKLTNDRVLIAKAGARGRDTARNR